MTRLQQIVPEGLVFSLMDFSELSPQVLYEILQARVAVFIVEQRCLYQDLDGLDPQCQHLLVRSPEGVLLAYARIVPPGLAYEEIAIGRVITTQAGRGKGLASLLMHAAITECESQGARRIRIGAQAHLQKFYKSCGFITVSEPYDEDGIAHVEMLVSRS
jgi:ElaA protein